jgi:hypothetical protein
MIVYRPRLSDASACIALLLVASPFSLAQQTAKPASLPTAAEVKASAAAAPAKTVTREQIPVEDPALVLSPFLVEAQEDRGYLATSTLAGTRLRTNLRDVGSAISVVTEQFLKDTAANTAEELLIYTTGTEIGGVSGNFSGVDSVVGRSSNESESFIRQNSGSRVRGLGGADNTRDYFVTDIPWDGYNIGRVEMQRGPNSILFGLGNPSGVMNAGTNQAGFKKSRKVENRFDQFGSFRVSLDLNQVLLPKELAVRFSLLDDETKYRQKPSFNNDKRAYGALRYDPSFLARNGARTSLRINYEHGEIDAMRPRTLPPVDRISPWFQTGNFNVPANALSGAPAASFAALNRRVFDWNGSIFQARVPGSGISAEQNRGRSYLNATNPAQGSASYQPGFVPNPLWTPGVSESNFGGVLAFYDSAQLGASAPAVYGQADISLKAGLNSAGAIQQSATYLGLVNNGGIDAIPFVRWQAVTEPWKMFQYSGTPYGSFYRDPSFTDTGVFDFYNNVFDGETRKSWRDFDVVSLALDQLFFNGRVGVNLAYDHQAYGDGQLQLIGERNAALSVDLNGTFPQTNLPNPNAGRAMIQGGSSSAGDTETEREEFRATVFAEFRATDVLRRSWLTDILGRHVMTGLGSQNTFDRRTRGYQRYMLDPDQIGNPGVNLLTSRDALGYTPVFYLTPDLRDASKYPTLSSVRLTPLTGEFAPQTVNVSYFDSTWTRSTDPTDGNYVNPGAVWVNPFTLGNSTQSENPANYRGMVNKNVRLLDAAKEEDRKRMMTSRNLDRMVIDSQAFVWQGFLFGDTLVPTFGYRKDHARAYSFNSGTAGIFRPENRVVGTSTFVANPGGVRNENGLIPFDQANIRLPSAPTRRITTVNRSWSVVGHTPRFLARHLPWGSAISLSYNQSSNFNPNDAGRRNLFGGDLAPSQGSTKDYGVLVSMLENRVNFRVVRFKTAVQAVSTSSPLGLIVETERRAYQSAKRMQAGLNGDPNYQTPQFNYGSLVDGVFTQTAADRLRQAEVVNAVLNNIPREAYQAWGINTESDDWRTQEQGTLPANATATQDRSAEGWEYEITVLPLKNWRVTANLSRTSSVTTNNFADITDFVFARDAIWRSPAGDIAAFNPATGAPLRDAWNANVMGQFTARVLTNGQKVQEQVPLRWNLVSTYDFTADSRLKGFSFGGAYRKEDKAAIGYFYKVETLRGTRFEVPDLGRPIFGRELNSFDAWLSYSRRFERNLQWKIQLNIRNLGDKNSLVPISAQPNGVLAQYRIKEGQSWTVTNTFSF